MGLVYILGLFGVKRGESFSPSFSSVFFLSQFLIYMATT